MIGIPSRGESEGRWEELTTLPAVRSLLKSRSCLWSEREGACWLSARCWDHHDEEKGDFLGGSSSDERLAVMWLCGDRGDTLPRWPWTGLSLSKSTRIPWCPQVFGISRELVSSRALVSPGNWCPPGNQHPQDTATPLDIEIPPRTLIPLGFWDPSRASGPPPIHRSRPSVLKSQRFQHHHLPPSIPGARSGAGVPPVPTPACSSLSPRLAPCPLSGFCCYFGISSVVAAPLCGASRSANSWRMWGGHIFHLGCG